MTSEYLYYFLTIFFGAVAWFVGYYYGDFYMTVQGWSVGLVLSVVLCIPDWPMYNRNPVQWAEKEEEEEEEVSEKKKNKKDKKDKKEKKEKKEKRDKKEKTEKKEKK